MATLLQNIQDVALELGLPPPNSVVGSSDTTDLQLLALMNRVGDSLLTERDWQTLVAEHRFQTVYYQYTGDTVAGSSTISNLSSVVGLTTAFTLMGDGIQQDNFVTSVGANSVVMNVPATATATGTLFTFGQVKYDMPADFERIVNKTQYNKSNRWSIIGPKDAQEWQWLKSSYITTGPRMRFRLTGDKFTIWPAPSAVLTMGYEYISNSWVVDAGGTGKKKFTVDTDTSKLPDRLLILGTKLKFFEIKGFDTSTLLMDYIRELDKFKSTEAAADTLSLAPKYANILLTQNNLPDTGLGNVGA